MTHYFKNGNVFNVEPDDAQEILTALPAGTYVVKKNAMTGRLFLQTTEDFSLPAKVYGSPTQRIARIKSTFYSRSRSTGVLLAGDKGSGKTLLSKALSIDLMKDGVPTIVINEAWCGQEFNNLIANINQPALVIFDEFDKVYDGDDQEDLLTLLDGTVETKKLFVLTTNSGYVDPHLLNRPGRIYYKFSYEGIDEDFIREYLEDCLLNKQHIENFVSIANNFSSFTFDMMQAVVEEMNRYDESVETAMQYLNVDISNEDYSYAVDVLYDGKPISNTYYPVVVSENPLLSRSKTSIDIYYSDTKTLTSKEGEDFPELQLSRENFVKIGKSGAMLFEFDHGKKKVTVVVEKLKPLKFNYNAL